MDYNLSYRNKYSTHEWVIHRLNYFHDSVIICNNNFSLHQMQSSKFWNRDIASLVDHNVNKIKARHNLTYLNSHVFYGEYTLHSFVLGLMSEVFSALHINNMRKNIYARFYILSISDYTFPQEGSWFMSAIITPVDMQREMKVSLKCGATPAACLSTDICRHESTYRPPQEMSRLSS